MVFSASYPVAYYKLLTNYKEDLSNNYLLATESFISLNSGFKYALSKEAIKSYLLGQIKNRYNC